MAKAKHVWVADTVPQRMTHLLFRREIHLRAVPAKAVLHLYAQTHYHLRVNGTVVNTGPARSYPEFPEYDSHDLAPYLKKGANVIGVHVAHVGLATFHHTAHRGRFVAWGSINDGGGKRMDLSTGIPGTWRCCVSEAFASETPRFSFAIGPIQIFDECRHCTGWDLPGTPEGVWTEPVIVDDDIAHAALRPRSIDNLTQNELTARALPGAYSHVRDENIFSFAVYDPPDQFPETPDATHSFMWTFLHSPRPQQVAIASWWGNLSVNGVAVKAAAAPDGRDGRQELTVDLREGWNFLCISYRMVRGMWEMILGLPIAARITVSSERQHGKEPSMMVAGPLSSETAQNLLKQWPYADTAAIPPLPDGWRRIVPADHAVSPARELAWARFGEKKKIPFHTVRGIAVAAREETSLVFDMGAIRLGRIFVEFDAPAGTRIDIGYAEDMHNMRPHYYKMPLVNSGERHIAAGGASRLETFFPRGFRYLQVGISSHDGPVTIRRTGVVSQIYPYRVQGAFACSDPFFTTLWQYGLNTLRLCSEDLIVDCPWRERTLYGGDLLPEAATTMAITGDMRLVRRCIEVFLQSQSPDDGWLQSMAPMRRDRAPLFDYPLIILLIAEWYCRLTDDRAFAGRCRPVFDRMLQCALDHRESSGLFTTMRPMFVEHGYQPTRGRLCTLNALTSAAFAAWSSMLTMLGRKTEAARARRIAGHTARLVKRFFWDTAARAYADAVADDNPAGRHSMAANEWALLFCSQSAAHKTSILDHLRGHLPLHDASHESRTVSPYGMFYLLGALYEAGDEEQAENWIRTVYSPMIERPTGTLWEFANEHASLTHAWSSAANYYLSTRVLGVRLGFPDRSDLSRVVIAPQAAGLSWARGSVAHPRGTITVAWAIRAGVLHLDYHAPEGVRVTVAPGGRLGKMKRVTRRKKSLDSFKSAA